MQCFRPSHSKDNCVAIENGNSISSSEIDLYQKLKTCPLKYAISSFRFDQNKIKFIIYK